MMLVLQRTGCAQCSGTRTTRRLTASSSVSKALASTSWWPTARRNPSTSESPMTPAPPKPLLGQRMSLWRYFLNFDFNSEYNNFVNSKLLHSDNEHHYFHYCRRQKSTKNSNLNNLFSNWRICIVQFVRPLKQWCH